MASLEATGERLFNTPIGTTKAMRQAAKDAYVPPEPVPAATLNKANPAATHVRPDVSYGPLIVSHPEPRKGPNTKKDNALTPRGASRNTFGGFYCS